MHVLFFITCSPEAVYYTQMIPLALCFHFINFICTYWQWREIPLGILTYSSLLTVFSKARVTPLIWFTAQLQLLEKVNWKAEVETEEFKILKGPRNEYQCIPLDESQESLKD